MHHKPSPASINQLCTYYGPVFGHTTNGIGRLSASYYHECKNKRADCGYQQQFPILPLPVIKPRRILTDSVHDILCSHTCSPPVPQANRLCVRLLFFQQTLVRGGHSAQKLLPDVSVEVVKICSLSMQRSFATEWQYSVRSVLTPALQWRKAGKKQRRAFSPRILIISHTIHQVGMFLSIQKSHKKFFYKAFLGFRNKTDEQWRMLRYYQPDPVLNPLLKHRATTAECISPPKAAR